MLYLLSAIVSSSLVSIMMRLSEERIKNNISALAVNYAVCVLLAGFYTGFGGMAVRICFLESLSASPIIIPPDFC